MTRLTVSRWANYGVAIWLAALAAASFFPKDADALSRADDTNGTALRFGYPPSGAALWLQADGNANDSSANRINAALINGVGFATGRSGQAFAFNGSDMVQVPYKILLYGNGDFSGVLWLKTTSGGFLAGNGPSTDVGQKRWFVSVDNGIVRFSIGLGDGGADQIAQTADISGATTVSDDQWHLVAWVRSSGTMKLAVDGNFVGVFGKAVGSADNSGPIAIGGESSPFGSKSTGFAGSIDDVALYNRALSAQEVMAAFQAPPSPPPSEPTAGPKPSSPATANLLSPRIDLSGHITGNYVEVNIRPAGFQSTDSASVYLIDQEGKEFRVGPLSPALTWSGVSSGGTYRVEVRDSAAGAPPRVVSSAKIVLFGTTSTPGKMATAIAAGLGVIGLASLVTKPGLRLIDWLQSLITRIVGDKGRDRTKDLVRWTLPSWMAIMIAMALMAVLMAAGKAGSLAPMGFVRALAVTGLAALVFKVASAGANISIAHLEGQKPHYRFWTAGTISFAVTNVLLHVPLGYTGFVEKETTSGKPSKGPPVRVSLAALAIMLTMIGFFLGAAQISFAFAQTGISLVLGALSLAVMPFGTLECAPLWKWSKPLAVGVALAGMACYVLFQLGYVQSAFLWVLAALGFAGFLTLMGYETTRFKYRKNTFETVTQGT